MTKYPFAVTAAALGTALLAVPAAHAQVTSGPAGDTPYCREFTQTVTIAGKTQQGWGTACLQPDGSWQIQPNTTQADNGNSDQPGIQYVVEDQAVYMVPPQPFVTGSIWIEGRSRSFDDHFRPHRGDWGWGPQGHWGRMGPSPHRH